MSNIDTPKKKRTGLKIAGGIAGLAIIAAALGSGGSDDTTAAAEPTTAAKAEPAKDEPKKADKAKTWTDAVKLSGTSSKESDTFRLHGGKTRIVYDFKGADFVMGIVYLLKEGTNLMEDGGFPEFTVDKAVSDSTMVRRSKGDYFVNVESANSEFTVTVQEFR